MESPTVLWLWGDPRSKITIESLRNSRCSPELASAQLNALYSC